MVVCILSVNEQNLKTCIFDTCHKTNGVIHVCKMPTVARLSEMVFSHLSAWYSRLPGSSLIQQSLAHNRSYILDQGLMAKLVATVKTPKPIYNANSFTKHKKIYLTTHSKISFDTKHKRSTKNVQQYQARCLDVITWLSSPAVTSMH